MDFVWPIFLSQLQGFLPPCREGTWKGCWRTELKPEKENFRAISNNNQNLNSCSRFFVV